MKIFTSSESIAVSRPRRGAVASTVLKRCLAAAVLTAGASAGRSANHPGSAVTFAKHEFSPPPIAKATATPVSADACAQFPQRTVIAAPVAVTANFSIPFRPSALAAPSTELHLTAAVNEIKPLPLAIANLSCKATEYRVTVEAGDNGDYNGSYGLKGFPADRIIVRQAVRTRDGEAARGEIFDALPQMNEASTLMIPPREAGLVWFDFNTRGVKPGVYRGVIRIVPLNQPGRFISAPGRSFHDRDYEGAMLELPLTLTVQDITLPETNNIPSRFFATAVNAGVFNAGLELGCDMFSITPWSLKFPLNADGTFKPEAPEAQKVLDSLREYCRQSHVPFRFFIAYSFYHTFTSLYGLEKNSEKALRLWPEWLKTFDTVMKQNHISYDQFSVELEDEPEDFAAVLKIARITRQTLPQLNVTLTLGAQLMTARQLRELSPYIDTWILWREGYFRAPEHLEFIRSEQAKGKKVHHYTCDIDPYSPLDRNYRRTGWFGEFYRLDGNDMYQLTQTVKTAGGTDFLTSSYGNLVLLSADRAIPTLRYMALRQGMTDVKYLARLREVGRNSAAAQAFLATAAKRVCVDSAADPAEPDRVREEAARLILKLQQPR